MPIEKHAVVLGARSLIGPYLGARLAELGYTVEYTTRRKEAETPGRFSGLRWTALDARAPGDWAARRDAVVFSLLPLWRLPPLLPRRRVRIPASATWLEICRRRSGSWPSRAGA
jgi:NAD(P)-dependent dehydrogenase (short-subunit alcohol dehydrogenase family)